MTGTQVHIPTLETGRLILRAPRQEDFGPFMDFLETDRSRFVGGPTERRNSMRGFGHVAGLWVTRGYSLFVIARNEAPDQPIGMAGPWYPELWPELEFGWSLWDVAAEGQGYVTEAMRALLPWAWEATGAETAVSYIDANNDRSIRVAEALGASRDAEATAALNAPGAVFHDPDGPDVLVFRHARRTLQ